MGFFPRCEFCVVAGCLHSAWRTSSNHNMHRLFLHSVVSLYERLASRLKALPSKVILLIGFIFIINSVVLSKVWAFAESLSMPITFTGFNHNRNAPIESKHWAVAKKPFIFIISWVFPPIYLPWCWLRSSPGLKTFLHVSCSHLLIPAWILWCWQNCEHRRRPTPHPHTQWISPQYEITALEQNNSILFKFTTFPHCRSWIGNFSLHCKCVSSGTVNTWMVVMCFPCGRKVLDRKN